MESPLQDRTRETDQVRYDKICDAVTARILRSNIYWNNSDMTLSQ